MWGSINWRSESSLLLLLLLLLMLLLLRLLMDLRGLWQWKYACGRVQMNPGHMDGGM